MRLRLILRLILALIFATLAVIFSDLIPPIGGTNTLLVKVFATALSAWIGFLIFPDVARYVKTFSQTLFNITLHRVSQEFMNQLMRLPKAHFPFGKSDFPFGHQTPQIGQVQLTKPMILDTSSIIDGRILDVFKTGFLSGLVLVPRFVLSELQQVSDSKDELKRQRGRRGFNILEDLKKIKGVKVEVWDKEQSGKEVDDKLLNLSKSLHGKILTCDFNLNRIATITGAAVLNINDLANSLKTVALPGEEVEIKIVHLGKDSTQGVGYLADGTMAVVADAADLIGKTIKVEVTKTIQIPQGRMIFGKKSS